MENRFGIKDFLLFVLVIIVIIMLGLAMKQYDRQYEVLQKIADQGEDQMHELTSLHRELNRLQTVGITQDNSAATTQPGRDPFIYQKQAEAMPGYSQGDWYVNCGPNSDNMTPFLSGDTFADGVQGHIFDSLCGIDEVTLEQVPNVATSWQIQDNTKAFADYQKSKGESDDQIQNDPSAPAPVTVTYQLRHDVVFPTACR